MIVGCENEANMYERIMKMVHLMMLMSLVYIEDDTKVGINVSEVDTLLLRGKPCSKEQSVGWSSL
jgi:hypothetical protein